MAGSKEKKELVDSCAGSFFFSHHHHGRKYILHLHKAISKGFSY